MHDVIVVPQTNPFHKLKTLVLDSVSSPMTRRVYNLGLDEFFAWYGQEARAGFTKAVYNPRDPDQLPLPVAGTRYGMSPCCQSGLDLRRSLRRDSPASLTR